MLDATQFSRALPFVRHYSNQTSYLCGYLCGGRIYLCGSGAYWGCRWGCYLESILIVIADICEF